MPPPRPVAIIGAPTSIGIRPYDNGEPRQLDRAPEVLRSLGVVHRLAASDFGDIKSPPYVDRERPPGRPRNEEGVAWYNRALAERVAAASADDDLTIVLGGDCSIVLGGTWGARRRVGGLIGLVYVDAHADFSTPEESRTGSAASMCLALAVGRGETPLARLAGDDPLVRARDVALIGRRDAGEVWYGHAALAASPILDIPGPELEAMGPGGAATLALERVTSPELTGFWIHLDADVIDPEVMPAVDSPVAGGPGLDQVAELLEPLVRHPLALGLELTIYDPGLDPDRTCAERLIGLLERVTGAA